MNANSPGNKKGRIKSFFGGNKNSLLFPIFPFFEQYDFHGPLQLLEWLTWIDNTKNMISVTQNMKSYFLSQIPSSAIVLDFGCGNGWATAYTLVQKPNAFAVGVDITPKLVGEALKHAEKLGVRPRCDFILCDCTRMPFREGSFDIVMDLNVIHHLSSIEEGLISIHGAVKKGGSVLVVEVVTNNLLIPIGRRLSSWLRSSFSSGTEVSFTSSQLARSLNSVGLEIMRKCHDLYFIWVLKTFAVRYPRIAKIIPKPILMLLVYLEIALQKLPLLQLSGGMAFFVCLKS